MNTPRVVVVGGCSIDYVLRAERLPSPGHSVAGDVFLRDAGGKGLNQAVAVARLGATAALIAAAGADRDGDDVIAAVEKAGVVSSSIVRLPNVPTACTLICVDARGRKQSGSRPGANQALVERDVPDDLLARARIVLAQLEIPMPAVLHAARIARRAGAAFILDAGPAAQVPDDLIALCDVVTANDEEALALTGVDVRDETSAMDAARVLRRRGARCVALGAPDGRAIVGDGVERWLPNYALTPVDTTGAGDACAAGISVGLVEGLPFAEACELGHAAAALATTRLGALASLPSRREVDALRQHEPQ